MQRLLLFLGMLLLAFSCEKSAPDPEPEPGPEPEVIDPVETSTPPNILLIIADDLGVDAMSGYPQGGIKPYTPTLNQLAQNGLRMTNVWAYPVCSPTRAAILTGKYGLRTGVLNAESAGQISPSERIIQQILAEDHPTTFATSIIGKWHLSARNQLSVPEQMGVGHYAGLFTGGVDDYSSWTLTMDGQNSPQDSYITTALTDRALDWIGAQSTPWFCWLAYNAPHTPFHLPPAALHHQGALDDHPDAIANNPMPYYMAMIESLDTEIGRLLAGIPAEERENTLIVFLGDNGSPNAVAQFPFEQGRAKGSLYQGGVHVPMIVAGKGVERRGQEDALISVVDLFNTLLEAAGSTPQAGVDSQSFYPLLTQTAEFSRPYIMTEILGDRPNRSGYAIRNRQYKYIVFDNGRTALYHLEEDEREEENLLESDLTDDAQAAYAELTAAAAELRGD